MCIGIDNIRPIRSILITWTLSGPSCKAFGFDIKYQRRSECFLWKSIRRKVFNREAKRKNSLWINRKLFFPLSHGWGKFFLRSNPMFPPPAFVASSLAPFFKKKDEKNLREGDKQEFYSIVWKPVSNCDYSTLKDESNINSAEKLTLPVWNLDMLL